MRTNSSPAAQAEAGMLVLLDTVPARPAVKAAAAQAAAAALDRLRARLMELSEAGNIELEHLESSAAKRGHAPDLAAMNAVKDGINRDAAAASRAVVASIITAAQTVLDDGAGGEAAEWFGAHGFDLSEPAMPPPITATD